MDWNMVQAVLRMVLQGVAGTLVTKGVTDASTAEAIVGGLLGVASLVWSRLHHQKLLATPAQP